MRTVSGQCESGGQCNEFEEEMSMATDGRVRGTKGNTHSGGQVGLPQAVILPWGKRVCEFQLRGGSGHGPQGRPITPSEKGAVLCSIQQNQQNSKRKHKNTLQRC